MTKNTSPSKSGPGNNSKCEILAPAGSMEKLKIVIRYGADAVYLGGNDFSLRAHADNFTSEEIKEAAVYCRQNSVKLYVTANIFAHNRDLAPLEEYLLFLKGCGIGGLIISDPGVLRLARKIAPEIPVHISTQANVTNLESLLFWQEQGANRVNLARELSLAEIKHIAKNSKIETEVFIHGALCISYSGRCLLSLYLTGRNSNQGDCAHPCRYSYYLQEEKRPNQLLPIEEDGRGTYILNSKDLCLLNRLPELVGAGVSALKIEGRMKGVYYAGGIVRIYRATLDFIAQTKREKPCEAIRLPNDFRKEIDKLGTRGYSENFFDQVPKTKDMLYHGARISHDYRPVAVVIRDGAVPLLETRHPLKPGDQLEYMGEKLQNVSFKINSLEDDEARPLTRAMPGEIISVKTSPRFYFKKYSLIRKTP